MKTTLQRFKFSFGACIAALLICTVPLAITGCTPAQQQSAKNAAALIAQEIPKAEPLLDTAISVATAVLPSEAPLVASVGATVRASLTELAVLCNTYAQSPSASVWASIQDTINKLVNENADALLDAAHIKDPVSRGIAQGAIGALQTVLLIIDSYSQRTNSQAQNVATAQLRPVKLREEAPYLNQVEIAQAAGYPFNQVMQYEAALGF